MTELMQAVIKTKAAYGAELVQKPIPKIMNDWVLVKVKATSICGTDTHIYEWNDWADKRIGSKQLPQILGHEVAGDVVEVGSYCKRIKVGDYVSAETHIYNPNDLQALLGQLHIGDNMKILGVDTDGAFAEYFAIPESVCWINDKSIPPEIATVQEPIGNACYALLGEDNDIAGKTLAIFGDGPTALFATALARACGVAKIFVLGMSEFALNIAQKVGADFIINSSDLSLNKEQFIKDNTSGFGTDIVLDMVGAPSAITEGFKIIRKGGRYSAFGVSSMPNIQLDYNNGIVFKGIQIHGISGRRMFDTWYRVKNLLASKRVNILPIITHALSLADFKTGFDIATSNPRQAGKIILFPDINELANAKKRLNL